MVRTWPSVLLPVVCTDWGGTRVVLDAEEAGVLLAGTFETRAWIFLFEGDGVTTCFSTSDAALELARARIWGSDDSGKDSGKDLGRNRLNEDSDDFPLL